MGHNDPNTGPNQGSSKVNGGLNNTNTFRSKVIVCIPAYNEEISIAKVIIGAQKYVDTVLVCDDGSTDMTGEIARRLGTIVLRNESNLGKGETLKNLMKETLKFESEIVVTIDADDQFDPHDIPLVIEPILSKKADMVVGARPLDPKIIPRHRLIGNKLLSSITNLKTGTKVSDTQSGFRAYSTRVLKEVTFTGSGMSIESQTLIDAVKRNFNVAEVQVSVRYKGIKSKRNPIRHIGEVLDYIITRTAVESPLIYLGLPGLLSIIIGIIAGLIVVNILAETGAIAIGTALISMTLIIVGSVLTVTSLIIKLLRASGKTIKN